MRIDLKWLDPNKQSYHRTEIYRSTEKFDAVEDATLIATVGPGISEYQDIGVIYNEVYYYKIRFIDPPYLRPKSSALYEFRAATYTGPGTTNLTFGDENFGYFGTIPSTLGSSPDIDEIRDIFGLTPFVQDLTDSVMYKFAIGGTVRCAFQYPVASGEELPLNNVILQKLISGEPHYISKGLHQWAMILPSVSLVDHEVAAYKRYPGELRSMLGVVTDLYTRIEDVKYGNTTGDKLIADQGLVSFYEILGSLYPEKDLKYIVSEDWPTPDTCHVINWTGPQTTFPEQPKELHVTTVDYSGPDEWAKTLIWPVFIYLGLVGPQG